jgi:hypothetical protein
MGEDKAGGQKGDAGNEQVLSGSSFHGLNSR